PIEVIGGPSALTHFLAEVGEEILPIRFLGFLPPRVKDREKLFEGIEEPSVFYERPHRMESTLEILKAGDPLRKLALAKELTKISEAFYVGTVSTVVSSVKSYKGEWVGCLWPPTQKVVSEKR